MVDYGREYGERDPLGFLGARGPFGSMEKMHDAEEPTYEEHPKRSLRKSTSAREKYRWHAHQQAALDKLSEQFKAYERNSVRCKPRRHGGLSSRSSDAYDKYGISTGDTDENNYFSHQHLEGGGQCSPPPRQRGSSYEDIYDTQINVGQQMQYGEHQELLKEAFDVASLVMDNSSSSRGPAKGGFLSHREESMRESVRESMRESGRESMRESRRESFRESGKESFRESGVVGYGDLSHRSYMSASERLAEFNASAVSLVDIESGKEDRYHRRYRNGSDPNVSRSQTYCREEYRPMGRSRGNEFQGDYDGLEGYDATFLMLSDPGIRVGENGTVEVSRSVMKNAASSRKQHYSSRHRGDESQGWTSAGAMRRSLTAQPATKHAREPPVLARSSLDQRSFTQGSSRARSGGTKPRRGRASPMKSPRVGGGSHAASAFSSAAQSYYRDDMMITPRKAGQPRLVSKHSADAPGVSPYGAPQRLVCGSPSDYGTRRHDNPRTPHGPAQRLAPRESGHIAGRTPLDEAISVKPRTPLGSAVRLPVRGRKASAARKSPIQRGSSYSTVRN